MVMKTGKASSFISCMMACIAESLVIGLLVSTGLVLLVILLAEPAQAEITHEDTTELPRINSTADVKQGSLLFRQAGELRLAPLLKSDVVMQISGMVARVSVKQRFNNITAEWQEGIYVFPLPDDAAVDSLRMHIGERIIEGEIKERQQAKAAYKQARDSGRKAGLVEQERANIFTTSVANIAAGETITVEIRYQQVARYDAGEFSLRFPMVVAPRYIPGNIKVQGYDGHGWAANTDLVSDAARITPPVLHPDQGSINPISIRADLDAGFPLQHISSSYHTIRLKKISPAQYVISLGEGNVPADRDFELRWQPESAHSPRAALFSETHAGNQYALLMLIPPEQQGTVTLKREVIFVIDTSGSMAGASIKQARQALLQALGSLKAGDYFNVIQFNSHTSQLFHAPQAVNSGVLQQARSWVQALDAGGGTEMAPALQAALVNTSENRHVRQIVFITDGSIGNEEQLFGIIEKNLGKSRLFTVGIGSAPNSYFMRHAAETGRGSYTFIGQISEVESRMQSLFTRLESPVLTNLALDLHEQDLAVWPQKIPDLYRGEPLLLAVRAKHLPDSVRINGLIREEQWHSSLSLSNGKNSEGVAKLWARKKIAALMDLWHLNENRDGTRGMIIETALEHHLVSKFTSLVAIDKTPVRTREAMLKSRPLPVNLPHGWQYENVFGQLPATATPAGLNLLLGLLLLVAAALLTVFYKHVCNY